jgi:hypothetical protein
MLRVIRIVELFGILLVLWRRSSWSVLALVALHVVLGELGRLRIVVNLILSV